MFENNGQIRRLLFKFVDFLCSRSAVSDRVIKDISSESILKAKSNFTLLIYIPFQDICE